MSELEKTRQVWAQTVYNPTQTTELREIVHDDTFFEDQQDPKKTKKKVMLN